MSWLTNLNPFKKVDAKASTPGAEGAGTPEGLSAVPKGMMAKFMGKLKDPAFMKQLRALASHMQKDGIDVKDMSAVKAWLEKNKDAIERGDFKESAAGPGVTFEKTGPEVGRNDPCHCGSGKKFKKCHGA
jgi:uncharacterized protein YchJ